MAGMGAGSWFNTATQPTSYSYGTPTTPSIDNSNGSSNNNVSQGITGASPSLGWIDQALQSAQSTDDPSYWYTHVESDPKAMSGDQSAINYWIGRINQGNGALAVRQGLIPTFNDGPSSSQSGLSGISDASINQLNQTLQDYIKQQNTPQNVTWTGSAKAKPTYGFNPNSMYGGGNMMSMNPSMMNSMNNNYNYTGGLKGLGFGG